MNYYRETVEHACSSAVIPPRSSAQMGKDDTTRADSPRRLSNSEIVTVAVFLLGGASKACGYGRRCNQGEPDGARTVQLEEIPGPSQH